MGSISSQGVVKCSRLSQGVVKSSRLSQGVVMGSISSQGVVMDSILKFAQDFFKTCARLKHYFLQRIS